MKKNRQKEGFMSQPRRMLKSSFHLKTGTIITPLLLYYLHLVLEYTKNHQFVQYTPKKCFNSFLQSAVDVRRQGDETPDSNVVAETRKFLANSSYVYQIMDRSRHTVTKYLNDKKAHSTNNIRLFKQNNFITDQLYEVELVKSEIEHREQNTVGFFSLQYAKLRMLEFFYNFSEKSCNTEKYEELEMDTDAPYLVLSEENSEAIILPEKGTNGKQYVRENEQMASLPMQSTIFSQKRVVLLTRSMLRESRDYLKKKLGVPKSCACVAKPIVAAIERVTSIKSVARDSIRDLWKTVAIDPFQSVAK